MWLWWRMYLSFTGYFMHGLQLGQFQTITGQPGTVQVSSCMGLSLAHNLLGSLLDP